MHRSGNHRLLFSLILIVPHFVDLGLFKRTYLPLVEEAAQPPLDVGEVRLSLVPTPSIRLSNLKVSILPHSRKILFFRRAGSLRLNFGRF